MLIWALYTYWRARRDFAAMFLQKKLTAAMGAQDAILHASQRLWPVLALHDPVLVVWIAEALTYVRPVEVRAEPREAA